LSASLIAIEAVSPPKSANGPSDWCSSTDERAWLKTSERENRALRRGNETPRQASAFSAKARLDE
jgi:hypothetical protein